MAKFTNKSIVVLGASGGLGAAIVRCAAAEGARTLAVARRRDRLLHLASELTGVEVLALDATAEDAPAQVFQARLPCVLVICAGARPPTAPIQEMNWEQFSANWDSDVKMSFLFCRAALNRPLARGAVVILISSGAALGGSPISGGYAGAKRTQMFMANYSQKESDRLGLDIRFLALAPSMIMPNTELGQYAAEGYAKYLGVPAADFVRSMKSPPTPQDVAEAVIKLAIDPEAQKGSAFTVSSGGIAKVQ
jgi:NAD(P)-dependent dehydrogenase (short-subunit alcohol dehydrogenase family)